MDFCRAFVVVSVLALAPPGTPAAQDSADLTAILAKNVLSDEDRARLRSYIEQRVAAITAGSDASKASAELRSAYATGTPAFRQAMAGLALELFAQPIREAQPVAASQLLAILTTYNDVNAARLFVDLLKDPRPGIRTSAAVGLRNLRAALVSAGGAGLTEAIDALRAAGKKETAGPVLREIYAALNYPAAAPGFGDAKTVAQAVLEVIEARVPQYESGAVAAPGADTAGLGLAGGLAASLDDAERDRLIVATAKIFRSAVVQYITELHEVKPETSSALQVQRRDETETLILECEKLLTALVKTSSAPAVGKKMQDSEAGVPKVTDMKLELNKWAEILKTSHNVDIHIEG